MSHPAYPQYNQQPSNDTDMRIVLAYILWFFIGYLGVHQFILGNTKRGIQYLMTLGVIVALLVVAILFYAVGSNALAGVFLLASSVVYLYVFVMWVIDLFTIPRTARGIY